MKSFLHQNGLQQYEKRFGGVDGAALMRLSPDDLRQLLDVTPNRHETNEASLELITALVTKLRGRSATRRKSKTAARDEL